jgi:radical SAM superfamily enzyme YgiQ (UPF0313 family)
MKIALIIPKNSVSGEDSFYDFKFYTKFLLSRKYIAARLGIPTVAALTPSEHEVRIFDENVQGLDFDWPADVAGISVLTMMAPRAYEICRHYRDRGATTVLGGIHPSMCTQEALQHCDSVVVGEAEQVWPVLLEDLEMGRLQRVYQAQEQADMTRSPRVARAGLARDKYLSDMIQTTKGCPFHCEFCSVHASDGQHIRHKTVDQVIQEIEDIQGAGTTFKKKKAIFFADDNFIADKAYARELFEAIKPYKLNWMCQASINISEEEELLRLMRASGCGAVFIGFESISEANLRHMNKAVNRRYNYIDAIQKIQAHGILVHASFILGYDSDTWTSFDELIAFIRESRLLIPLINIMTPFPGTRLFDRLERSGRILHKDWARYDTRHAVFVPANMSPEELEAGYRRVFQEAYSFEAILERLNRYWDIDFWQLPNTSDPVRFKYRILFALRLATLLVSTNLRRSRFIIKLLPKVFDRRVRVSSILGLMAYNDFAYSQ